MLNQNKTSINPAVYWPLLSSDLIVELKNTMVNATDWYQYLVRYFMNATIYIC